LKSSVSRTFVERTREALVELLAGAIEHDLVRTVIPSPTKEVASLVTA
jgi:hypothetical protein